MNHKVKCSLLTAAMGLIAMPLCTAIATFVGVVRPLSIHDVIFLVYAYVAMLLPGLILTVILIVMGLNHMRLRYQHLPLVQWVFNFEVVTIGIWLLWAMFVIGISVEATYKICGFLICEAVVIGVLGGAVVCQIWFRCNAMAILSPNEAKTAIDGGVADGLQS